jgi:transcription-repair coupling factor (superfamily II helicase)
MGTRCFVLSRLFRRPYQIEETDNANVLLRAEVLNRINCKPAVIVSYPEALFEK